MRAWIVLCAMVAITSRDAAADQKLPPLRCPAGTVARQQRPPPVKDMIIKSPEPSAEQLCARPDGTRHGPYVKWWRASVKALEGGYRDGLEDGPWTSYSEDGKKTGESEMRGGKSNGRTTLYYPGGRTKMWEGSYRDGLEDGESRQWDEEGKLLGSYRLVRGTGTKLTWNENGTKESRCEQRDGKEHGRCTTWRDDGSVLKEEEYRNGVRHGRHVSWWDQRRGRKQSEGSYRNGKREGVWREWSFEGKLSQGTFRNDKLVSAP
jgi:antitoxin component YwqK of YwqJK toxin-antitoxin module